MELFLLMRETVIVVVRIVELFPFCYCGDVTDAVWIVELLLV